jgi:hypothetical protein
MAPFLIMDGVPTARDACQDDTMSGMVLQQSNSRRRIGWIIQPGNLDHLASLSNAWTLMQMY